MQVLAWALRHPACGLAESTRLERARLVGPEAERRARLSFPEGAWLL